VWQLAYIVYPSTWAYFAIAAYGFSTREVGLALAVVGITSALVQGFGLRLVMPRLGERRTVMLGVAGLFTAAVLYTVATTTWEVYLAIAVGAIAGMVQPSISAMNSRAVDARSQGELQGATQSINSIAAIIGPPLYTQTLARFSGPNAILNLPGMTMLLAASISVVAMLLFLKGASLLGKTPPASGVQPSSSTSQ
jgi:DHA1 family tetracycline resistance protein-like MFS transporter